MDATGDLLRRPLTALPHDVLLGELIATFGGRTGSWTWRNEGGSQGAVFWSGGLQPQEHDWQLMRRGIGRHPMVHWYSLTADHAPQTLARINQRIQVAHLPEMWREVMHRYGTDQLSIPLSVTGGGHRAYVLADSRREDWPEEDLAFARRLQPLLIGLERQASALARHGVTSATLGVMDEVRLTARELAVLRVLGAGCTVRQIAHRLAMSPRTAEKHLEHVYTKLRVADRLSAVLRAQQLGLLQRADQDDAVDRP